MAVKRLTIRIKIKERLENPFTIFFDKIEIKRTEYMIIAQISK